MNACEKQRLFACGKQRQPGYALEAMFRFSMTTHHNDELTEYGFVR